MATFAAQISVQVSGQLKATIHDLLTKDRQFGPVSEADVVRYALDRGLKFIAAQSSSERMSGYIALHSRTAQISTLIPKRQKVLIRGLLDKDRNVPARDQSVGFISEGDVVRYALGKGLRLIAVEQPSDRLRGYAALHRGE